MRRSDRATLPSLSFSFSFVRVRACSDGVSDIRVLIRTRSEAECMHFVANIHMAGISRCETSYLVAIRARHFRIHKAPQLPAETTGNSPKQRKKRFEKTTVTFCETFCSTNKLIQRRDEILMMNYFT